MKRQKRPLSLIPNSLKTRLKCVTHLSLFLISFIRDIRDRNKEYQTELDHFLDVR